MKIGNKLIKVLFKTFLFPIIVIVLLIDKNIGDRLVHNRYTLRDILPHLISVLFGLLLYYLNENHIISIRIADRNDLIKTIVSFQGILFATSLAVSTFILSIFNPNDLIKNKYPNKKIEILDTVDDLRIANYIIFVTLIYIFIIWVLISINIIPLSTVIIISIFSFNLWSILSINSIIHGVFLLIRIER